MTLHLHGVVRANHALPDDSPFRLVELEDLAVVVSDRPDDHALTGEEAVAHLAGLCALLPGGPVLPLRIGTTAVDEATARGALLALTPSLLRPRLDQLDGMAEMHVHLVFDEDTVAWRPKHADALLEPVSAMARAMALLDAPGDTEERRAYLVPLDQVEAMRAAVAALGDVTAACTGPLPAYHFLDLTQKHVQREEPSRWGW